MNLIETLMEEHRGIEKVLAAMYRAVNQARAGGPLDVEWFARAREFVRDFADGTHHAKEENLLFPALFEHGIPRVGGPVACMLSEHETGRDCMRRLDSAIQAVRRGEKSAQDELLDACEQYAHLLTQHIQKEDCILFQMAKRILPPSAFETMAKGFGEIDSAAERTLAAAAQEVAGSAMAH